jgi:hypothetical protein
MVCKLLESIYELKQSFRTWYERLDTFLLDINFKRTKVDPNIYIKSYANVDFIMLAIYVDDGIVVTPKLKLSHKLKIILVKEFDMVYEGEINYCVGLHIIRSRT